MPKDSLTVIDNRTGDRYEFPIEKNAIHAADLRQVKVSADDPGLLSYDPTLATTATCKSKITSYDPETGSPCYRGYSIEELAEKSNYLETAYLIVKGELPDVNHFEAWKQNITIHTMVHENIKKFMDGFRHDAPPMGIVMGTLGALSTFYPDAMHIHDLESRRLQTRRLIGKLPTLAAFAYRRTRGLPYVYPDNDLSYTGNFLSMLFKMTELRYTPDPVFERALDVLFILHADDGLNCSTHALRCVASSQVDPFSAVAAATAALAGPAHGGAQEAVLRMLGQIGSPQAVPGFVKRVKEGEAVLVGFRPHPFPKPDPRVRIAKQLAEQIFERTGRSPLMDIALELETVVLEDRTLADRQIRPTMDLYTGIAYQAMGFPATMFAVLLAIARTAGWMAHWAESVRDPEQTLAQPSQLYIGEGPRKWLPIEVRPEPAMREDAVSAKI